MAIFCRLQDLKNESDVEQKLLWPLLTSPQGLGYAPPEIFTKPNIQSFEIEKGNAKKVYRPDYILVLAGMPVVVIEAKHPDEDIYEALREARLYAAELNGFHPSGVNPCARLIVSNGKRLLSSPSDTAAPDLDIEFAAINTGSLPYHKLLELVSREPMQTHADRLRSSLRGAEYHRAINLLGGNTARNEEVGYNEFGSRISIDFLHVFNPQTRQDRAEVVRNAYVRSKRREHYTDEIDRVIRTAMPTPTSSGKLIEDTSNPSELLRLLGRGADLQNRIFLLVGSVGAGKSTFVDYLREVKLDEQVKRTTEWVSINLNGAPVGAEELQRWVVDQFIRAITCAHPNEKLTEYDTLTKVFGLEMRNLKSGPLKLLPESSDKYREIVAAELMRLTGDRVAHATALARHLCAERGKVLVLVLDNCDKGDLEEQLTVFQIVRWVQTWLKCLVFLPIRDVTYHAHKNRPPLDTVIKDFVFRVESPPFGEVLRKRIQMALAQAVSVYGGGTPLSYTLESGIRVVYPPTEVGFYLACLYRSLFEHDQLLRRMLVGLAGKNIRKAMEIFLDFCKSGHIGGREFLQIRMNKGDYALPYKIVTRVLLRLNRRFYDGNESHLKNVFQCVPEDPRPDHFVRLAILRWLQDKFRHYGPTGVKAFHRAGQLITDLVPYGHDADRVRAELRYLVEAMCVLTEHQRTDSFSDDDLIRLSAAGHAHLHAASNFDYLAACAEDTWVSDVELAERVATRIGQGGIGGHYARETMRGNAAEFIGHLVGEAATEIAAPDKYLSHVQRGVREEVARIGEKVARKVGEERSKDSWDQVDSKFKPDGIYNGKVQNVTEYGVFVDLAKGVTGLLHRSKLGSRSLSSFHNGDGVAVRVLGIDRDAKRIVID
jgi:hypothetical protein